MIITSGIGVGNEIGAGSVFWDACVSTGLGMNFTTSLLSYSEVSSFSTGVSEGVSDGVSDGVSEEDFLMETLQIDYANQIHLALLHFADDDYGEDIVHFPYHLLIQVSNILCINNDA